MVEQIEMLFERKLDSCSPITTFGDKFHRGADLTEGERTIISLLKKGRANALSVRYLAGMTGMSELEIRQNVKHLVEDHNTLIVSATSKPAGYYYPETDKEYEAGAKQLEHRITSLARRLRAINKQAYEKIFGQRNLKLEYELFEGY